MFDIHEYRHSDRHEGESFEEWLCRNGVAVGLIGCLLFWLVIAIAVVRVL